MNARTENAMGIFFDMPNEAYHASPGISCTGLKAIARSPLHYYSLHRDPKRPARESTPAQLVGTLAHCAILEPQAFEKRYVTVPKDAPRKPTEAQWNAKDPSASSMRAMDWWEDFRQRTAGKTLIASDQYDVAQRQAESVRRLPEVRELLDNCKTEVSAFWIDAETGAQCRCRPDLVHPAGAGVILGDVKTYSNASPHEFRRQIASMLYHLQDALYTEGYAAAAALEVLGFVFIAVETEWPYAACSFMLDDQAREKGRALARTLLSKYAECERTGVWPGYADGIELVSLPRWAM
jgi:hypothetical protein